MLSTRQRRRRRQAIALAVVVAALALAWALDLPGTLLRLAQSLIGTPVY